MKNKPRKIILIVLGSLLGAALLLLAWFIYVTEYKITDIDSVSSPDGEYELVLHKIGEFEFPFGATHVKLVLKHDGRIISEHETEIANDGKNLFPENWRAAWSGDCVEVTLRGEEQEDEVIILRFSEAN